MKLEQWQKIKEILGAALDREPQARSAFLDEACIQDRELRAEVESLLAAYAKAGALSENPWLQRPPILFASPKASAHIA